MTTKNFSQILSSAIILMLMVASLSAAPVQSAAPTLPPCSGSPTYLVADGVTAAWSTAYSTDLQATIDAAHTDYVDKAYSNCVEWVWVAKGTYRPAASDRTVSFQPKEGVGVYGGFAGSETSLSQRDWVANPTILSGDLLGNDGPYFANNSDNSYNVVNIRHAGNANAILDGFTITGGNANGPDRGTSGSGGGINNYNDAPILANLKITNNYAGFYGGGMYDAVGFSTMTGIIFTGNYANQNGGGMYLSEDQPVLDNVLFYNNKANNGGAMFMAVSAHPILTNATSSNNAAFVHGSALFIDDTSFPTIQNSILWGDQITPDLTNQQAGGLQPQEQAEEIYILPAAPPAPLVTVTASLVYGCKPTGQWNAACGTDGGGNLPDADPAFLAPAQGDLHLRANSPAIDHGSNTLSSAIDTDLDGNARLVGTAVDLGAYEQPTIIYVDANTTNTVQDGKAWSTAFISLQDGLAAATAHSEIWVARGVYKPTTTSDRSATFALKSQAAVYGGLVGTETAWQDGDWRANPTLLSGDLLGNDGPAFASYADNSYHVVSCSTAGMAILNGFTITGGNATGPVVGVGGGLFIKNGHLAVTSVAFTANAAEAGGGGLYNGGSLSLNNTIFSNNQTLALGGGVLNESGSLRIANSIFFSNSADKGGGLANNHSSPILINVTFNSNRGVTAGNGIYNDNSSNPTIANSILWGDYLTEIFSEHSSTPTITYSLVQGCNPGAQWHAACGASGGHNLADVDPLFINAIHADLHLRIGSKAVASGSNAWATGILTDLDGQPRILANVVDLGAYEQPAVYYVNINTTNTVKDCLSWATACTDLQETMSYMAEPYSEVWVARGTYYTYNDRTESFYLRQGVAVYGGFAGFETARVDRNWRTNPATLSGDIGAAGDASDNNYHVVSATIVGATSALDGFTITGGNANGASSPDNQGGGMLITNGSPTLANLIFKNNQANSGGGLFNDASSPALTNVVFQSNTAVTNGGGIANSDSAAALTDVAFAHNSAGQRGGGLYTADSLGLSPVLTNLSFSGNTAPAGGGAIYNSGSHPLLQNSILWGDSAGEVANPGAAQLTIRYSLVQGCHPSLNGWTATCGLNGGHNLLDGNPYFIDPAHNNLRLVYNSPAIDHGNSLYIGGALTDLDNKPRVLGLAVDLGAYEFPNAIYVPLVIK